ncbi:MAG: hypothetical protein R2822_28980 [Spirosomataceae bacterium]
MKKLFWRELDNPTTYYDGTFKVRLHYQQRIAFMRLVDQLIREDKTDKAKRKYSTLFWLKCPILPFLTTKFRPITRQYLFMGETKSIGDC